MVEPVPYDRWRALEAQRAVEEARAMKMDETVPGGRYKDPDGNLHDAFGREPGHPDFGKPEPTNDG